MEGIALQLNPKYQTGVPRAVRQILGLQADDTLLFM